jgi:hypothetical protein
MNQELVRLEQYNKMILYILKSFSVFTIATTKLIGFATHLVTHIISVNHRNKGFLMIFLTGYTIGRCNTGTSITVTS